MNQPRPSEEITLQPPFAGGSDAETVPQDTPPVSNSTFNGPCSLLAGGGRFGDYELLEEVARGGMGVVFRARQVSLNRIVALKMILAGQLASDEDVRRFHSEAEAAANLDHPGIVPVFEVGQLEGQYFFSMGFIEGQSLADRLVRGPLAPLEAAELVRKIAAAVAYAHAHGVIHRDLKPGNILLDTRGPSTSGTLAPRTDPHGSSSAKSCSGGVGLQLHLAERVGCSPRITDFGLVKKIEADSKLTASGQILGTPSYMSPEQASGKAHAVTERSDVYALGAILYACLTGRPPFAADSSVDILMKVLEEDPTPPRLVNRSIPRDLETICLKCLRKDPADRYATAVELEQDLGRFLAGDPVEASDLNVLERLGRVLRTSRHEQHFSQWGQALIGMGVVVFLSHVAIWILTLYSAPPRWGYWTPRSVMLGLLFVGLWWGRSQSFWPTNAAERPIWAVWVGYLLAMASVNTVLGLWRLGEDQIFAVSCVLAGMGFFASGNLVWGGCYAIGMAFFLLAPLLTTVGESAALWYGLAWGAALCVIGARYWRRRSSSEPHANTPPLADAKTQT